MAQPWHCAPRFQVLALPNVHHMKMRAEDAIAGVQQLLGSAQLDLLVCDMNIHPFKMMGIALPLLPLLKPGARVVGRRGGGCGVARAC